MKLALFQPDIPQNVGAAIRLCACMDLGLDIIEPCGFPWDKRKIAQSAMDYIDTIDIQKHSSWGKFVAANSNARLVLMTTKASQNYLDFDFHENDILLAGRESAGVPEHVHEQCNDRIKIEMQKKMRSLNIVNASSMIIGEALRQIQIKT